MTAPSGGGEEPPDKQQNNGQTLPEWMDRSGEFGQAHFLVLQAEEGHSLPKNPFIVGKSIQTTAGEIERAHTEADRSRYVLKVRKPEQVKKLVKMTKLIDGTPVKVDFHPHLNYTKCVVSCWEAIDMTEEEIKEQLGPQGVTHVYRMTKRKDGKVTPLPTLILTVLGTVAPEHLKFGPLIVKTRIYVPEPMLCYNCWTIGHTKRRCTSKPVCGRCGGDHDQAEKNDCKLPELCVRCKKTDHGSYKRTCKVYQDEKEVQRLHAVKGLSFEEARKAVKNGNSTYAGMAQQRIENGSEVSKILAQKNREILDLKRQVEELTKKIDSLMCQESATETESELEKEKESDKVMDVDNPVIVINRKRGSKKHRRHDTVEIQVPPKKVPSGDRSFPVANPINKQAPVKPTGTLPKQRPKPGNPQQATETDIQQQFSNINLQATTSVSRT